MDPRHPEVALTRIDQLVNQFKGIIDKINIETTSNRLGQLEREGGLVVQEICLVAPRLHEAMMQTSRQRRHDLSHGVIVDMSKYKVPDGATGEEVGIVEELVRNKADVIGEENIGGESVSVKKPVVIEKLVETELDKEVDEVLKPLEEPKKKRKYTKKKKVEE